MDNKSDLYNRKQFLKKYAWQLSAEDFTNLILKDIEFIFQNFQEKDELNEHYDQKFELELGLYFSIIIECLRSDQSPEISKLNKQLRLSEKIKTLILELLRNQKYANSRADLIRGLGMLKWDKELAIITQETSIWANSYLLSLELVEALTKRRIKGFHDVFSQLYQPEIKNELNRSIKKYLDRQIKFKKHKDDFIS